MRVRVELSKWNASRADTPYLTLALDSLFPRLRAEIKQNPELGIALARAAAQLVYRLASERYLEDDDRIVFQIELAKDELEALKKHAATILENINAQIHHFKEKLPAAKCKSCVEARIEALYALFDVVSALSRANPSGRNKPALLGLEEAG